MTKEEVLVICQNEDQKKIVEQCATMAGRFNTTAFYENETESDKVLQMIDQKIEEAKQKAEKKATAKDNKVIADAVADAKKQGFTTEEIADAIKSLYKKKKQKELNQKQKELKKELQKLQKEMDKLKD